MALVPDNIKAASALVINRQKQHKKLTMTAFIERFWSNIQGPHKHCYAGALAVGTTFLISSCLGNTSEALLGFGTLGLVALYTLEKPKPKPDTSQAVFTKIKTDVDE